MIEERDSLRRLNDDLRTDVRELVADAWSGRPPIETRRPVLATLRERCAGYGGLIEAAAYIAIIRAGWRTGKALVP